MMRRKDLSLQWVSVNSHAVRDNNGNILYYEGTLQDITSRKLAEEELSQLKKTLEGVINAISSTVEMREPCSKDHQKRVSKLAGTIANEMGFTQDAIKNLVIAGLIHDIGKISIPAEILNKPAQLSEMEFSLVRTHALAGYNIVKTSGLSYPVSEVVLQHHERLNGSGYPTGLKGVEILLESRILAVADVVEAIVSNRPYRLALGINAGLTEIKKNKGILYDTDVVNVCLKLFQEKQFTF